MDHVKEPAKEEPKEIVVGSVVRLKSGGPVMSCQNITKDGMIDCAWHNEDNSQVLRHNFTRESLEIVDAKEGNRSQGKTKTAV